VLLLSEQMKDFWYEPISYSVSKGYGKKKVAGTPLASLCWALIDESKGRVANFLEPPEKSNSYEIVISIIEKQYKKLPGE